MPHSASYTEYAPQHKKISMNLYVYMLESLIYINIYMYLYI